MHLVFGRTRCTCTAPLPPAMPNTSHHSSAPIAFVALLGMVLTSAATWVTRSSEEQQERAALQDSVQESSFLLRNELDQLLRRFERLREQLAKLPQDEQRNEFAQTASDLRFGSPFIRWIGWQSAPLRRPVTQMQATPDGGVLPMIAVQPAEARELAVEPSTLHSEFGVIEPSIKEQPPIVPRAMPYNGEGNSLILLRAALPPSSESGRPHVLTLALDPDTLLLLARNMRKPRPLDLWLSTLDAKGGVVTSTWFTAVDFEREDNPTWSTEEFTWCGLDLRLESIQPGATTHGMSMQAMTVLSFGLVATMVATLLFSARRRGRDLERQVKARTRELQLSMAELRSYGETVANELREPLERIDDFCRSLRTEWAEAAPRSALLHVETIGANSREMAARIAMLRRMPELLTRGLDLRVVDLDTMMRPLLAPHAEEQASRHIRIELGQLGKVTADPMLLAEVFRILLDNAVKSTRGREAPQITVERIADPDRTVISIHDNGSVEAGALQGVRFEPEAAAPGPQGLEERSLGLALCSRILARHGGGMRATGVAGRGTSFVLWLPLHDQPGD